MKHSKVKQRSNRSLFILTAAAILVFLLGFFMGSMNMNEVEAKDYISGTKKYYTAVEVETGDTLWAIADEYMTAEYDDKEEFIDEVRQMNNITGSMIKSGNTILVPYYK